MRPWLAVLLLVAGAACDRGGDDAGPSAVLRNNTSVPLYVYASQDGASDWGSSRGTIPPGEALSISLAQGAWDFKVVAAWWGCSEAMYAYSLDVPPDRPLELDVYDADFTTGSIFVENVGNDPITEVYIRPTGTIDWGPDRASSDLSLGSAINSCSILPGSYDVRCRTSQDDAIGSPFVVDVLSNTWVRCAPALGLIY